MSRIGKKPITLPKGVKYTVQTNTVVVEGPKGKVSALIPQGITLSEKDGILHVERQNDSQAAVLLRERDALRNQSGNLALRSLDHNRVGLNRVLDAPGQRDGLLADT